MGFYGIECLFFFGGGYGISRDLMGVYWNIYIYMMGYLPVMTNRCSELEDGPVEMT